MELAESKLDVSALRRRASEEARDDTPAAMDRVWEEEVVRFGREAPGENCGPPGCKADSSVTPEVQP
jgi:nitrate reductase delta subunit